MVGIVHRVPGGIDNLEPIPQADQVKIQLRLPIVQARIRGGHGHGDLPPGILDAQRQVLVLVVQHHAGNVALGSAQAENKPVRLQAEAVPGGGIMGNGGQIHG